jgi:tetratricopeptide (TPR) repeat protein
MLVTIQQFALNHLRTRNEETELRNSLRGFFLDLAEQADKEIHGPNQVEWMNCLEVEHDNLRAALDWSISNQQPDLALRLLNALCWPWLVRTHFNETRSSFEMVRNLPESSAYPMLYARLLNFMGRLNWLWGEYQEGESFLKEAHAIWLNLGTEGEQGLAEVLEFMGLIKYSSEKDFKQARSLFTESLSLYQKHQNLGGIAIVKHHLGDLVQN